MRSLADLTRRYATFLKVPAGIHLIKIASGANNDDYRWTEIMARETQKQVDAVSLHYYTGTRRLAAERLSDTVRRSRLGGDAGANGAHGHIDRWP